MNEWIELFGLESVWDDPDWPTLDPYPHKKTIFKPIEEKPVVDLESYQIQKKLRGN